MTILRKQRGIYNSIRVEEFDTEEIPWSNRKKDRDLPSLVNLKVLGRSRSPL